MQLYVHELKHIILNNRHQTLQAMRASCCWNCISQSQMLHHFQVRPDCSVKQLMGSRLEWEKEASKFLTVINYMAYSFLSAIHVQDICYLPKPMNCLIAYIQ